MENNKKQKTNSEIFKPVMLFYAKTTSWVIFPLILGIILARVGHFDQTVFFGVIMVGFGVTCFGIYREIKGYKKELEKKDKV
jgi:hypothetical protein